jgi:apolipoprotein N-acyltransferase
VSFSPCAFKPNSQTRRFALFWLLITLKLALQISFSWLAARVHTTVQPPWRVVVVVTVLSPAGCSISPFVCATAVEARSSASPPAASREAAAREAVIDLEERGLLAWCMLRYPVLRVIAPD